MTFRDLAGLGFEPKPVLSPLPEGRALVKTEERKGMKPTGLFGKVWHSFLFYHVFPGGMAVPGARPL